MDASQKSKLIKELRDRTGAGFLDVKKALEATEFKMDAAIDWLKENGKAKAAKKGDRIAADGLVAALVKDNKAVIYEINSETDFVAGNDQFKDLVKSVGQVLLANKFDSTEEALTLKMASGETIATAIESATATIGEKISFRRAQMVEAAAGQVVAAYTHTNGRVATIVLAQGSKGEELRDVAMHVAAMNPEFLNESALPQKRLDELQRDATKEAHEDPKFGAKPEKIQASIISGKVNKALSDFVLVKQAFVKEQSQKVEDFLKIHGLAELLMVRYEVGEGIEKVEVDFAAEVAAQMKK